MSNQPKEKHITVRMPVELYEQATLVKKLTGISVGALIKDGLRIVIAEQKKRANTLLVDAATLDALREHELDTGMPPNEQIQDAVAYWFRVKKVNRD